MARRVIVHVLLAAVLACGCSSAPQQRRAYPDGPAAAAWEAAAAPAPSWWDEHPVVKYTGIGMLVVTGSLVVLAGGFAVLAATHSLPMPGGWN